MIESQNPTRINPIGPDTRHKKFKGFTWLIVVILLGAIILISILIISSLLRGHTPSYSPANFEAEYETNHVLWDGLHVTHYIIVVNFSGYGSYDQMPWTLEILNENVISVINAQGNSVPVNDAARWFTISSRFTDINDRYQRRAPIIRVFYNSTYGYPEKIYINPYKEPCCQDYEIEVQKFQILP